MSKFEHHVEAPEVSEETDELQGLPESVKVEQASAPLVLQQPDYSATGPWIKYDGVATVRIITMRDWTSAGINGTQEVQWNYLNHMRLPKSQFSEEELHYLLNVDGRFSLVED